MPSLAFAVTSTDPFSFYGDLFVAKEIGELLKTIHGWDVAYLPRGDTWYEINDYDVIVAMTHEYDLNFISNKKQLIKVCWARNWFEEWCKNDNINNYDLIFASSRFASRWMSQRLSKIVHILRLAASQRSSTLKNANTDSSYDFIFTGNYWGAQRDIIKSVSHLSKKFNGAVFGVNWENTPEFANIYKGPVQYEDLHLVYSSAKIVIDDANHVTKDWGAANSRIFDVLATGTLVITNSQSVSQDVFSGVLPCYKNPQHLHELVSKFVNDEPSRLELSNRLRFLVLNEHLYLHRSFYFDFILKRSLKNRGFI